MCAALVNGFPRTGAFSLSLASQRSREEVVQRTAARPPRISPHSLAKTVSAANSQCSRRAQSGSEKQPEYGSYRRAGEKLQELQCAPGLRLRRSTHSEP